MYFITFSRKIGTKGTELRRSWRRNCSMTSMIQKTSKKSEEMGFLDDIREVNDTAPPLLKRFFSLRPEICLNR